MIERLLVASLLFSLLCDSATAADLKRDAAGKLIAISASAQSADAFIAQHKSELGIKNAASELSQSASQTDSVGRTHIRYQQMHKGLPVLSGELRIHTDESGRVYFANTALIPVPASLGTKPKVSARQAQDIARREWQSANLTGITPTTKEPKLYVVGSGSLSSTESFAPKLCWVVRLTSEVEIQTTADYFIDAISGQVLLLKDNTRLINRRVRDCSNSGNLTCQIDAYNASYNYTFGRSEAAPERGENPTPAYLGSLEVDQNHALLGEAHNYWFSHFGLNGANNQGGIGNLGGPNQSSTVSYLLLDHLWFECPGDAGYLGGQSKFLFCQGSGNSPDVVGHEYFHAVVWFEFSPNGTEYYGEIAALEEGTADFYGAALEDQVNGDEPTNWQYDRVGFPLARSLKDPPSEIRDISGLPYPDRSGDPNRYCGTDDHGGGHTNSTIFSKSLYLMSEGSGDLSIHPDGRFNGCAISGIGFDAVQNIAYHAWHNYFGRNTSFNEAAAFMQQSCSDLYGATSPQYCDTVTAALQAVEMDQLGYCLDPEGLYYYLPACAQPPVVPGLIDSARPTQGLASLFSPQEWVYALGAGWQNVTSVNLYLSLHETDRVDGTAISSLISPVSAELDESGSFVMPLWNAAEPGVFDLIVDGNSDGIYNSATDRLSTFEVRALTDGDGLCYAGERYETSENCRSAPTDCACTPQNGSPRYCTSFANQGRHRCLTLQQIQWLKAHPIEEAVEVGPR